MSINPSESGADFHKIAQTYKHNPNQHVVLDAYKDDVLMLRAKFATYDTITESLRECGVKVSDATVRNFCRRHYKEVKQLRAKLEHEGRGGTPRPPSPSPKETSSTPESTPGSFTESNTPGPSIALENF